MAHNEWKHKGEEDADAQDPAKHVQQCRQTSVVWLVLGGLGLRVVARQPVVWQIDMWQRNELSQTPNILLWCHE